MFADSAAHALLGRPDKEQERAGVLLARCKH